MSFFYRTPKSKITSDDWWDDEYTFARTSGA